MSGDTIRLGIVGCGSATQIMYVPVLRYVQRCAVTALCDPNPTALDEVRSLLRSDLDAYQGYDEFLRRAQVDAVIIATPVYLHREQVVKAARAGKHVLCEKPMARTLPECDEMIDSSHLLPQILDAFAHQLLLGAHVVGRGDVVNLHTE
ncbi:MAG: Gfo/Idh/MocA family oxidoreductase, partial [Chloroflexi bacterium]|nr:Gfo/Idh/MocA family oxidoreductase [Chloroflexota bacterium]